MLKYRRVSDFKIEIRNGKSLIGIFQRVLGLWGFYEKKPGNLWRLIGEEKPTVLHLEIPGYPLWTKTSTP